ncbi:type III secretion system protein [Yersinia enterocolitica]|uniref:InvB/SpaK family type III secretion system chaperone n=1 Tax=Yersinia enterocolitica TaxID=630 RepID=UPI001C8E9410|nr:type III secretion system protein [Yersinia enterocolitica]MBX9498067.1 type III secretion system protein [Yersinia enterocolitica]HDL7825972.1 type III secretion system protein [Yersinia enterocolitica]HDL7833900.1 type III secretion system protein [Yersinia enterocolitica]HDL7874104.1 type III secretion system protein [Yersinia enterocolitica]HDL7887325.1 type III secretion system protein [Yersinia enterocolitica]
MKYRFVDALNSFLSTEGRQDLINSQLDCHSTIQLELNESPPINVDLLTDDIILWCNIAECQMGHLEALGQNLLSELLEYTPDNFHIGQPALSFRENTLVLSAILREPALNDTQLFADSLNEFYERSHRFSTLLAG